MSIKSCPVRRSASPVRCPPVIAAGWTCTRWHRRCCGHPPICPLAIRRSSVLLPQPFWPTRPYLWPSMNRSVVRESRSRPPTATLTSGSSTLRVRPRAASRCVLGWMALHSVASSASARSSSDGAVAEDEAPVGAALAAGWAAAVADRAEPSAAAAGAAMWGVESSGVNEYERVRSAQCSAVQCSAVEHSDKWK